MTASSPTAQSARLNTLGSLLLHPSRSVGASTLFWYRYAVQVSTLIAYAVWRLTLGYRHLRSVTRAVLIRQVLFTAVDALPFTGLIAVLLGASVIAEAEMHMSGNPDMVGKLLVIVVVRELGPLIAALILLVRSGTAMVVEMGNMNVDREIDGLEYAGVDPFEYLVVPRIFGMSVSLVGVALYFIAIAIGSGVAFSALLAQSSAHPMELVDLMTRQLGLTELIAFGAKTFVPGLMIAGIVCFEGLSAGPQVTDVPRAATRGTVRAVVALFAWNVAVSVLLYI